MAMTLRDCTLFMKIPRDGEGEIGMRLGDLDLKSASKIPYWKSLERQLIDEGWYAGTEKVATSDTTKCMLW